MGHDDDDNDDHDHDDADPRSKLLTKELILNSPSHCSDFKTPSSSVGF